MAMRHRRGAGRFRRMVASFADAAVNRSTPDPERIAGSNEELAVLEAALAKLSDKKRAVFVLVELEGLTAEEPPGRSRSPRPRCAPGCSTRAASCRRRWRTRRE